MVKLEDALAKCDRAVPASPIAFCMMKLPIIPHISLYDWKCGESKKNIMIGLWTNSKMIRDWYSRIFSQ